MKNENESKSVELQFECETSLKCSNITSNVCSNFGKENDPKLLFGCLGKETNKVKVLNLTSLKELASADLFQRPEITFRTMWLPDETGYFPETIGVMMLTNIEFYKYQDGKLRYIINLLEKDEIRPIVSCDWNTRNYRHLASLTNDDACVIWDFLRLEEVSRIERTGNHFSLLHSSSVRFGSGLLENILICLERTGDIKIIDTREKNIANKFQVGCIDRVSEMEFGDPHFIAISAKNQMKIFDMRYMTKNHYRFLNYRANSKINCFSVHPGCDYIYIGTDTGELIKWDIVNNKKKHNDIFSSYVHNLHIPPKNPDILIMTGITELRHSINILNEKC